MDEAARVDSCVSIPKRVSEALNLLDAVASGTMDAVSIPKRVSEALNHWFAVLSAIAQTSFNP